MIPLVVIVGVAAVGVGLLGWWLAPEGPSPGLGMATVGAPLNAMGMGAALSLIRLHEASNNLVGDEQAAALQTAWSQLRTSLIAGTVFSALCLVLVIASWARARRAERPLTHWVALFPAGLLGLGYFRLGLAGLMVLSHWQGARTMDDTQAAIQVMVLLMIGAIVLAGQGVAALVSLLLGVGLRFRYG